MDPGLGYLTEQQADVLNGSNPPNEVGCASDQGSIDGSSGENSKPTHWLLTRCFALYMADAVNSHKGVLAFSHRP